MLKEFHLKQQLTVEFLGALILTCAVVGSGIMGDTLSGDDAIALLGNTIPTGAILFVLITLFAPISGAHFNPIVTLIFALNKEIALNKAMRYMIAQIAGAIIGVIFAHIMFEMPVIEFSQKVRTGQAQWISELIASFGLILTIFLAIKLNINSIATLVGLYITAAYWFTASTSFANPAIAIARSLTDSFSGIRPVDVPMFILAEIIGAVVAWLFIHWLMDNKK